MVSAATAHHVLRAKDEAEGLATRPDHGCMCIGQASRNRLEQQERPPTLPRSYLGGSSNHCTSSPPVAVKRTAARRSSSERRGSRPKPVSFKIEEIVMGLIW